MLYYYLNYLTNIKTNKHYNINDDNNTPLSLQLSELALQQLCLSVSSLTSTVGENLSASAALPRSFPASFTPKFNLHELQKNNTSSVNKICYYST
jgi:hypothetical protein